MLTSPCKLGKYDVDVSMSLWSVSSVQVYKLIDIYLEGN